MMLTQEDLVQGPSGGTCWIREGMGGSRFILSGKGEVLLQQGLQTVAGQVLVETRGKPESSVLP